MNTMTFEDYQAMIGQRLALDRLRGKRIGLNGGADFYGRNPRVFRVEPRKSLRVFLVACADGGARLRHPHPRRPPLPQGWRGIPETLLPWRFKTCRQNLLKLYAPMADVWALYDNPGSVPELLDEDAECRVAHGCARGSWSSYEVRARGNRVGSSAPHHRRLG